MTRHSVLALVAALALTVAANGTVSANGEEFFIRPAGAGPVELAYTGRIRDKETRRHINDVVYLIISDREHELDFPFMNDAPGRYRSPDVGASIKELFGTSPDPSRLQIQVDVSGYRTAVLTTLPRKSHGLVAFDLLLERDPAFGIPASDIPALSVSDHAQFDWRVVALVVLGLAAIGAVVARRAGPRPSTAS